MNEHEQDLFEAELRRLKPGKPPEEFMARLIAARLAANTRNPARTQQMPRANWRQVLRWLAPAAAAAATVVALLVWPLRKPEGEPSNPHIASAIPKATLKADDVEINQRLIAAFDAMARTPDGEPVRFRCSEWMDNMILRDSAHGVVVEKRAPRLEVVPVSFEVY